MRYILLLILLPSCYCKSQSRFDSVIIDGITIKVYKPIPTELTYSFPEIISSKLETYLNDIDFSKTDNHLLLSNIDKNEFELALYSFEKLKPKSSDRLNDVLKFTNRFTTIKGMKIPLLFMNDYEFGDMNQTITGFTHRIIFSKKYIKNELVYTIIKSD